MPKRESPDKGQTTKSNKKSKSPNCEKANREIVNDVAPMIAALKGEGLTNVELMAKAGVPATVQFSNNTKQQDKENGSIMKEKDLPDWAFLHLNPHADKERYKRRLPISNDGKTINKRLLSSKMGVIKYCMPYGKSIDWVQQSDVDKLVALRAFDHSQQSLVQDLNGVGDDICNLRA